MRCDLMPCMIVSTRVNGGQRLPPTRIVHALNDSWPWGCGIVDLTLTQVVASDEESSFDIVLVEDVEHITRVYVRSVIESECDHAIHGTVKDASTAICDGAKLRARHSRCIGTRWCRIGVTCRTIIELTVRCCAVRVTLSTPAL